MAEPGTFLGEVQRGALRFWRSAWWFKWPIIVLVAFVVVAPFLPSSDDDDKEAQAAADQEEDEDEPTSTSAPEKATNTPKPTETPKPPTNTPTPRPTATPAPPTPTPPPPGYTFGSGKKQVGTEVVAGATYRTRTASANCYWERLSGLGGTLGEILANDNTNGPAVVTIGTADVSFNSTRCGTWTQDLSPITTDLTAPFKGDGTFIVGVDISPGLWGSDGTGSCYWERLRNFTHAGVSGIIANDNADGPTLVQIATSDKGFNSSRCGAWTKQ